MPGVFAGNLQNFFNAMPEHRRSITKDGISFFPLIVFTRKNNFILQTRQAVLREVNAYGEIALPSSCRSSCIHPILIQHSSGMTNTEFSTQHLKNLEQIQVSLLATIAS
ncbi:MAG: hypothetical protein SCH68_11840 [Brevefilum sp.]|nr:hypothetical protein [Brevefilum sp.]